MRITLSIKNKKNASKFISISVTKSSSFIQAYKIKYGITQDKTAKNELAIVFEQLQHVLEY
jgi:hypothetical protein